MEPMVDESVMVPRAMAKVAGSSAANAGDVDAAPESGAARPDMPEEHMAPPKASQSVVRPAARPRNPPVVPPAAEEEDEVEEIEREESRPQAIRILHKHGDKVVVVEEEDTTREMRRLKSALAVVMKQIKVSAASGVLVFDVGDRSLSLSFCVCRG